MNNIKPYFYRILGGIFILSLVACDDELSLPVPIEVVAEPAQQSTFPIYGEYIATVQPSLSVEARARVDGFVEQVEFTEGSFVNEGKLLYKIDDRPYQSRVKRLQAALKSSQASVDKATRDLNRTQPLFEQDAASQLDLDSAIASKLYAEADVIAAEAELEEAKLELSYTLIKAPISGLVGKSHVDIGALVGSGGASLLATVKQVDPMFIEFHMSTLDYLNAQRRKQSYQQRHQAEEDGKAVEGFVQITLADDSRYRYWGDISFTDPQVNPDTGTFAVRAIIANPDKELLPGQYVRTRLQLESIPNAIIIDEQVIQIEQGGSFVMIAMPDETVERRFVVTGPQADGRVVITTGLVEGELVITEGIHKVQHGNTVSVLSPQEYKDRLKTQEIERAKAEQLQVDS